MVSVTGIKRVNFASNYIRLGRVEFAFAHFDSVATRRRCPCANKTQDTILLFSLGVHSYAFSHKLFSISYIPISLFFAFSANTPRSKRLIANIVPSNDLRLGVKKKKYCWNFPFKFWCPEMITAKHYGGRTARGRAVLRAYFSCLVSLKHQQRILYSLIAHSHQ